MMLTPKHELPWTDEEPQTNAQDAYVCATRFTDAAGYTSSYGYDSLNRLTGLTNTNSGSFGFGYDALGRRTSLTRPNGVNTSYGYDTLSRLLSVLHEGGSLPGSTSYTYDAAGNRLTKTAVEESNGNPVSVLSQFSYDNIYELTQAVVNGSVAEGYTYDAVGNRLTSAGPVTYNNNASNELTSTSAATYAYDNNGNTLSKTTTAGTTSYAWDFENRLTSLTMPGTGGTVNFKYDPFGRRIEKVAPTSGTTVYAYDGDNVTEELGSGGSLLAHYTQGAAIDEPLAITGTSGTYFSHADGLGSITSLTGGSGQLANSYVYDSFGNLTGSTGTITNPFQYTAREFDSETGLYYYRARYYDPSAGRFVSEDPVRFQAGYNFYVYVGNDPVDLIDAIGMCPWQVQRRPLKKIGTITGAYHVYFYNVQTGQSVGLGPAGGQVSSAPVPGTWEIDEKPGTEMGPVPEYSCDCVENKIKNRGKAPDYCSLNGKAPTRTQPCTNCNGWVAGVLRDCYNEAYSKGRL